MRSLNGAEEVLKQDERGRVRLSRERREALLAEFELSGMSGAKFARLAGLNYQTFIGWVRRRKASGGGRPEQSRLELLQSCSPARACEVQTRKRHTLLRNQIDMIVGRQKVDSRKLF